MAGASSSQDALAQVAPDEYPRSVFVTQIPATATLAAVREFFSFCGAIVRILLDRDPQGQNGEQFGVVVFSEQHGASSAMLLTNAVLEGSPIIVSPFVSSSSGTGDRIPSADAQSQGHAQRNPYSNVPLAAAVVGGAGIVLAKGSLVVQEVAGKVKAFDQAAGVSAKANAVAKQVETKFSQVDQQYQISEKVGVATMAAKVQARKIDEQFGISSTASAVKQKVLEVPQVRQGLGLLAALGSTVAGAVRAASAQAQVRLTEQQQRQQPDQPGHPYTDISADNEHLE